MLVTTMIKVMMKLTTLRCSFSPSSPLSSFNLTASSTSANRCCSSCTFYERCIILPYTAPFFHQSILHSHQQSNNDHQGHVDLFVKDFGLLLLLPPLAVQQPRQPQHLSLMVLHLRLIEIGNNFRSWEFQKLREHQTQHLSIVIVEGCSIPFESLFFFSWKHSPFATSACH